MEFLLLISIFLLILQALTAIILFERIEEALSGLIWQQKHKYIKPWTVSEVTPRELMRKHAICPLDIANLRGLRTCEYGQLVRSPSVLYHIADRYEKKANKTSRKTTTAADPNKSESENSAHISIENAQKKLKDAMERHANKLQRRRELEIYNCRKTNFKRFAMERMIGIGRHRNIVDIQKGRPSQ